ncbi:MAG: hypothetical protein GSR72_02205 [Desulfurococcales archaeon]|nr:hypothetical protein [Desulfurococcales archaeon]MEB3788689.1 hypothetical protein [Desulfurococcales archaeon]
MTKPARRHLIRVLCALYRICGHSQHCRVPKEAITRKLHPALRGLTLKALEELRRQGLVYKAGGKGKTYGLTREGLALAREVCREN